MAGTITAVESGTLTTARGFLAGATYAGLKTFAEDKLDLGLVLSETPCAAAGVFTTSSIRSPSVTVNQEHLARGAGPGPGGQLRNRQRLCWGTGIHRRQGHGEPGRRADGGISGRGFGLQYRCHRR